MYRSFLKKISASVGFLPEDLVMLDCEMTGMILLKNSANGLKDV
jgi:hypothetical protein